MTGIVMEIGIDDDVAAIVDLVSVAMMLLTVIGIR